MEEKKDLILLGKHLKLIRQHACLGAPKSQQSFAEEIGWTQKAFSQLENQGKDKPLPKKLVVVLQRMGCEALLKRFLEKNSEIGED